MSRQFRFGLLASRASSAAEWRELARKAEGLGYSSLLIADHFSAQLAPIPAAMLAAGVTSTLRIGTFVLDNDFRHPAAAAKEAATVQLLSDGRFEFGIGAGWNPADYEMTGIPFDAAGVRVSRLAEALEIVSGFFRQPKVTFEGAHFTLRELVAEPKPQAPPKLLIGANGPRMLRLAARYADIVNFPDRPRLGVSTAGNPGLGITFADQLRVLREAAGQRFAELELSVLSIPRLTSDIEGTVAALAQQMQTTPDIVHEMPSALIGSTESVVEKLQRQREQFGISYPVIPGSAIESVAPIVRLLAGT